MILTLQPLVSLDRIFKFELDLGVVRREFEADLVDELRSESEVSPALQVLVALMLKAVLATFVELYHVVADLRWI